MTGRRTRGDTLALTRTDGSHGAPVMLSRAHQPDADRTGTTVRTPGTATSYALRGMFVILAVLGSLVPVAQAVASLATEAVSIHIPGRRRTGCRRVGTCPGKG